MVPMVAVLRKMAHLSSSRFSPYYSISHESKVWLCSCGQDNPDWSFSVFQFSGRGYSEHCYQILAFIILICTNLSPATSYPESDLYHALCPSNHGSNRNLSHPQVLPCVTQSDFLDPGRKARGQIPHYSVRLNSHRLHWGKALLYNPTERSSSFLGTSTLLKWGQESQTLRKITFPDQPKFPDLRNICCIP